MKKIISLILIIIVTVVVVFLLWLKEEYKTYNNTRYSFSVDYPTSWTLGEAPTNNDGRVFTDPETGVNCRAYGFSNSLLNKEGKPQSLKEFVDWLVTDNRVGEGLYTAVIERVSSTLAGNEAEHVMMEREMNIWEAVYTLGSQEGRALYCIYDDLKERELYKDVFERMQKSFKIDKSFVADTESQSKIVEEYIKHTLGGIPGANIDYNKAREVLSTDLKQQFKDSMFVPTSYCIQDGPDDIRITSVEINEKTKLTDVVVEAYYGGQWKKMWNFKVVPDKDSGWVINKINCLQ